MRVKISESSTLERDLNSGAILNSDLDSYEKIRAIKKSKRNDRLLLSELISRIERLERQVKALTPNLLK